jgi:transcriptional regulator NrdR family protein
VKDSIRTNIATAAAPELPIQRLEELVDAIVAEVYPLARTGPISTAAIAEAVLSRLKEIDPATHIRFALAHARRHGHGRDQTRWSDTEDARRWLVNEYPHLHHTPALRGLSYVIKRDSRRKRYDRVKLERSIDLVSKGRGTGEEVRRFAAVVADDVERALGDQPVVTTGQIAAEVLRSLRTRDPIAYLRYASTAKRFSTPEDYEAEALALRAVASKAPSD